MKIRILRHVVGLLGADWLPGETHECPTPLARELVATRAAEYVVETPVTGVVTIEHADPVATHRDPMVGRKGRRP